MSFTLGPFSRPYPVIDLSREAPTAFDLAADPAERAALAPYLGVEGVEELRFAGTITPLAGGEFVVEGRLVARVAQICVITLEPLALGHELAVRRRYLPAGRLPGASGAALSVETPMDTEDDEPDAYTDAIDPAALAAESLLLAIDPYPRAPGAELGEISAAPPGAVWVEEDERPFARLAELRRRMTGEDR